MAIAISQEKSIPDWGIVVYLHNDAPLDWNFRELAQKALYRLFSVAGRTAHADRYSLFAFSLRPVEPAATAAGLRSRNSAWVLRLSSARQDLLDQAMAALKEACALQVGEYTLRLSSVHGVPLVPRQVFDADPILAFRPDGSGFWDPDQPEFSAAVTAALARRWVHHTGRPFPGAAFRFLEWSPKLAQYKNRDLLAFGGAVRLSAPAAVVRFAQCVGLGHKPSCGFGMLLA